MLAHPTLEQLHALGLHGLAKGFKELEHKAEARGLDHAEWLGLDEAQSAEIVRLQHGALHRIVEQRRKCPTFAARPISSSRRNSAPHASSRNQR